MRQVIQPNSPRTKAVLGTRAIMAIDLSLGLIALRITPEGDLRHGPQAAGRFSCHDTPYGSSTQPNRSEKP